MHFMQQSQGSAKPLLNALEVQELLQIDRSTVYRMAEDGRLPALRVGRSWRFPAEQIESLMALPQESAPEVAPMRAALGTEPTPATPSPNGPAAAPGPHQPAAAPMLNRPAATAAVQVAAELLGVMMVVTDMAGRPVTDVSNPCAWFAAHADEPDVLDRCVAEWRDLADHPDLTPMFQPGALGFECARAFVRSGSTLVGMVLAGGVSPAADTPAPGFYDLDPAQRERVLAALPRIAAAISTASQDMSATTSVPADLTNSTPRNTTKENR